MRKKLLYTGACGVIGRHVLPFLAEDYDLILTDVQPFESDIGEVRIADLTDFDAVQKLVEGVDVVVHAAIASSRDYLTRVGGRHDGTREQWHQFHEASIEANLRGTYHLMEAAARAGHDKFVFFSSLTVYLGNRNREILPAGTPRLPENFYSITKTFGEDLGEWYSREDGLRTICLQVGQPYPFGHPTEVHAKDSPRQRAGFAAMEDIALAVRKAVESEGVDFLAFPVLSESEHRFVDISEGRRIGYRPSYFCSDKAKMHPWLTPLWDGPTQTSGQYRIAGLATVYRALSHADVIFSRWLRPLPSDAAWGWSDPKGKLVSLYTEQVPLNDLGAEAAELHDMQYCQSVREALTLGTGQLAVDAVMFVGEHGNYPRNRYGQKLYPRKEIFDQIVEVFRESGRTVPVFIDKHLSWNFDWAREMVETAGEMGFPLFAGSTLPLCELKPAPESALLDEVVEGVILYYGDPDAYGYHSIEWALRVGELRKGGEPGIRKVRSLQGHALSEAWAKEEWPHDLTLQAAELALGRPVDYGEIEAAIRETPDAMAFQLEHLDGFKSTHLKIDSLIGHWFGAFRASDGRSFACRPNMGTFEEFAAHFAVMNGLLDGFLHTGKSTVPIERVLLSTGAIAKSLEALGEMPNEWMETPELGVRIPSPEPRR